MIPRTEAIVAGAGIGGLAAALALQKAGVDVRVYEQAPALGEVGAGISISPNGALGLQALSARAGRAAEAAEAARRSSIVDGPFFRDWLRQGIATPAAGCEEIYR